jgi:hypothetical protein
MSKLHAFTGDSSGNCHVVIHTTIPAGNNAVGKSWKSCWVAVGRNTTSLVEGAGVGQISSVEKASIVAGDVVEVSVTIPLDVVAQGQAAVNIFADALAASQLAVLAGELKYYGWTYS